MDTTVKARANISQPLTYDMDFRARRLKDSAPTLYNEYMDLLNKGWTFYVVDQRCGRCYFNIKVITIPIWAYNKKTLGYFEWYLAHEMSHAIAGWKAKHGPAFQATLLRICPAEYVHHESSYKPQALARAMICNGFIPDDLL